MAKEEEYPPWEIALTGFNVIQSYFDDEPETEDLRVKKSLEKNFFVERKIFFVEKIFFWKTRELAEIKVKSQIRRVEFFRGTGVSGGMNCQRIGVGEQPKNRC